MKYTLCLCIAAFLFSFGLSGCSREAESPKAAAVAESAGTVSVEDLLHRRFVLKTVNGRDYSRKERAPDLEFNEGMRLSGGICNRFTGQAELARNILTAPHMASTKMLCVDQDLNRLEAEFGQMLAKGAVLSLTETGLTLSGEGLEMVYERADWVR